MTSKKQRILFILPLPPPIHGSSMMSQYIQNSKLINEAFDCDFVNLSTSRKMDEIGSGSLKKLFRLFLIYWNVLRKLLTKRYELCYLAITCHGLGFLKDAPFVLLCKIFGCKVVLHQHNKGMSKDVNKFLYKWLFSLVYRQTHVILLSWRLYDDISKIVNREQVLTCPNGIPDTTSNNSSVVKEGIVPQILFLSNLLIDKGVFVLLEACKLLKEKGIFFSCVFVGGETSEIDRTTFKKKVKHLDIDDYVKYAGKQYGKEKDMYWINCDLFALPTMNECFPVVLLEAMQNSLPIVTTNEGGIPDIIQDGVNGYIVQPKDAKALADRLETLILNKELRTKLGNAGRRIYQERFTQTKFEQNLHDCLQLCLT